MEGYRKFVGNSISIVETRLTGTYVAPDTLSGFVTANRGAVVIGDHVLDGFRNPQWRDQIARHVNAGTPMTASLLDLVMNIQSSAKAEWYTTTPMNNISHRYGAGSGNYSMFALFPAPTVRTSHISSAAANNQAISRLYDMLSGFEGQSPIGEDLGEIGQTFKMLSSPMKAIREPIRDVFMGFEKALTKRSVGRIAKGLADSVLEYKFGVVPLIRQTQAVVHGLKNRDYIFDYYPFKATGKFATATVLGPSVTSFGGGGVGPYYRASRIWRQTSRVAYSGEWSAQAGIDKASVATVLGLRWNQVVPTIWNLFPYSWMLDYVSNIGNILEGLACPWGGVRWCSRTISSDDDFIYFNEPAWDYMKANFGFADPRIRAQEFTPGRLHLRGKYVTRSDQTNMPIPSFRIDPVGSLGHIVNLSALLASKSIYHSGILRRAVKRHPDLPFILNREMSRRALKVPYPKFTF